MPAASNLLSSINNLIVKPAEGVVFAAGFFLFMYGVFEFLKDMQDGSIKSDGKQHMLWGIIGMFIMVAVWGILNVVTSTFGIDVGGGSVPTSGNLNAPQSTFQLTQ